MAIILMLLILIILSKLTFIHKFLVAIFALNLTHCSSGSGITSSFDLLLKYCSIWLSFLAILQYLPILLAVFRTHQCVPLVGLHQANPCQNG